MANFIGKFREQNGIEKMSLIVLTDGECAPLVRLESFIRTADDSPIRVNNVLVDPVTKKEYVLSSSYGKIAGSQHTNVLLNIIKDRNPGVKVVGIYVLETKSRAKSYNNYYKILEALSIINGKSEPMRGNEEYLEKISVTLKDDVYCVVEGAARDLQILVRNSYNEDTSATMKVDENSSSSQISKQLSKKMLGQKKSRVFLDKFIETIS
jgi:hypothetical protein